jgi:hypothetical protein
MMNYDTKLEIRKMISINNCEEMKSTFSSYPAQRLGFDAEISSNII